MHALCLIVVSVLSAEYRPPEALERGSAAAHSQVLSNMRSSAIAAAEMEAELARLGVPLWAKDLHYRSRTLEDARATERLIRAARVDRRAPKLLFTVAGRTRTPQVYCTTAKDKRDAIEWCAERVKSLTPPPKQ